jgi:RNA recognition motif-containing protein
MVSKVYVGGLASSTNSEELRAHFEQCGAVVSAAVVTERDSGQSRGFGFVEMSTGAEAENAIAKLNQQMLGGKALTVNAAHSKTERSPRN